MKHHVPRKTRLRQDSRAPLLRPRATDVFGACVILSFVFIFTSCKNSERNSFKTYSVEPVAEQPLEPLPERKGASEVPETDDDEEKQAYNLLSFFFPLRDGYFGSAWCVCRSIGTSPHIGQDINADPKEEVSVAVWSGSVKEITFSAACGYILLFEDDFGGVWRYVHLNKPSGKVVEGARLKAGDVIGIHNDYPTSGCGTGAHLHIELREKGKHDSAEKDGKNCGRGWSDCFYNPRIIKPGSPASVERKDPAPAPAAPEPGTQTAGFTGPVDDQNDLTASVSADPSAGAKAQSVPAGCRADLLPSRVGQAPSLLSPAPSDWIVNLQPQGLGFYRIEVDLPARLTHECPAGRAGPSCVARMQLYTVDTDGAWSLLADRPGLRGRDPDLTAEHRVCAWPGAQELAVVYESVSGERFFSMRPIGDAD